MRGTSKAAAAGKDPEDYEDQFLHQTMGTSRIRSHTARFGYHKIHRHHHFTTPAGGAALPSTSSAHAPGAAGTTASSVSAYLEHLPSINLDSQPPPRPPRPPGGLLGISNGRGMGYGRSLGSSYDSPLTTHGSFNGHVRSAANLFGGKNHSSGLVPAKTGSSSSSISHHRSSMSVFPIQKALEIAMKESRLLAAASSKGGASGSTTGTGMSTGITFVRELRRARHARGAIITDHGPTPDISLDEDEDDDAAGDGDAELEHASGYLGQQQGHLQRSNEANRNTNDDDTMDAFDSSFSTGFDLTEEGTGTTGGSDNYGGGGNEQRRQRAIHHRNYHHRHHAMYDYQDGDIPIQRPAVAAFDTKTAYPGIAYMQHSFSPQTGILSLRTSGSLRNVPSSSTTRSWSEHLSGVSLSGLEASSSSTQPSYASSSTASTALSSLDSLFVTSPSSSSSSRAQYQSHFTSSSSSSSTHALLSPFRPSPPLRSMVASHSAVHAVRELLDSYPAPSPYCVDDKKRSPLHFAAASGDLELVEFLLERGVRPDCGRDIAGNMPLHLAIISNRIEVVAALLKAGADITLASPMTHKTPLDLAESRLSYLLARAQEWVKESQQQSSSSSSRMLDHHNSQLVSTRPHSFHGNPSQQQPSLPTLVHQIRGIVTLLRPYVARQQKLQHGERHKERSKERSWERADKYMRQQEAGYQDASEVWRVDPHSEDNFGDMEDEDEQDDDDDDDDDDDMDTGERQRQSLGRGNRVRKQQARGHHQLSVVDMDGDVEFDDEGGIRQRYTGKQKRVNRRVLPRRMDADETEEVLENLMNGLSLLEANRKQIEQQQQQQQQQQQPQPQHQQTTLTQAQVLGGEGVPDSADGNLADTEPDPLSQQQQQQQEAAVLEEALPDLLEQVQQVLQAIKLNEQAET
ncbi:hypothetical protein EDD11_003367 [Mortierella claussenii]|nr:hypothetical protein EDD11_003367 [Mortierella claussenii]